jgi:hypothetical protein
MFVSGVFAIASLLLAGQAEQAAARRIYVGNLGGRPEAEQIRKALIGQARKLRNFEVVDSPAQADAILDGDPEVYVSGYVSLYVRAGTSPTSGTPLYKGYVSVELKNRSGETIWSYLSTLHAPSKNPASDIAKDVMKHLQTGFSGSVP